MKIRKGFVSNSSSSSFIIMKKYLDKKTIKNLYKQNLEEYDGSPCYDITEDDKFIYGDTIIDNFSIIDFMKEQEKLEYLFEWRYAPQVDEMKEYCESRNGINDKKGRID